MTSPEERAAGTAGAASGRAVPATNGGGTALTGTTAIGWPRAIGSGVIIVGLGFLGVVYLPNVLLGQLSDLSTLVRSLIAATVSMATVVLLAVALSRLQARGVI